MKERFTPRLLRPKQTRRLNLDISYTPFFFVMQVFFHSRNFPPLFPYAVPPPRGNAAALRAASAPLRFRVCAVRPLRRRNSLRSFFPSDFFPPSPLFPTARFPRTSHAPPPGPAFGGIAMRPPFPPAESALGTSETSKVPPLPLTAAATSLKIQELSGRGASPHRR